jgi:hypothetical protein
MVLSGEGRRYEIARVLKLDQKPLDRRIEQVQKVLRRELEQRAFTDDEVG